MSQIPPLSKYSGNSDAETFEEWHEQFQLVATVCKWDERLKLANLATRLQGQAYSFYRTCSQQQRTSYEGLVLALSQRFKPVRIQAVQSGQFHSRKQGTSERVDEYAQDLSRLYQRAYPQTDLGSREAEEMGQKVLAYQFVSGLLPELKVKVAGTEGTFDQLWIKARFEEAKLKELATRQSSANVYKSDSKDVMPRNFYRNNTNRKCFICGQVGHIQRECPQQRRGKPVESRGSPMTNSRNAPNRTTTNHLSGRGSQEDHSRLQEKIARLRNELQAAELQGALLRKSATMHVLRAEGKAEGPTLGPSLLVNVLLEGHPVKALVDTGSPITIVSIDCLLDTLAKNRAKGQTVQDWKRQVEERLQTPSLSVSNYGGGEVNVISQLSITLTHGEKECQSVVLVQKGASLELLLGTDVLAQLGFYLLGAPHLNGQMTELLKGQIWQEVCSTSSTSSLRVDAPIFTPASTVISAEETPETPQGQVHKTRKNNETTQTEPQAIQSSPLEKKENELREAESLSRKTNSSEPSVGVKLLKDTRIPARHSKIVQVKVVDPELTMNGLTNEVSINMLKPRNTHLQEQGIVITNSLIQPDEEGCFKIFIENHSLDSVYLDQEQIVGALELVTPVPSEMIPETKDLQLGRGEKEDSISLYNVQPRVDTLVKEIPINWEGLGSSEATELQLLIKEYADVFALDPSEVGRTEVVQHNINTSTHPSIKQAPRRIPFSLCPKVEALIQEMLDQEIVKESSQSNCSSDKTRRWYSVLCRLPTPECCN